MQTLDRDEVSIVVAAPPEDVYVLVEDVTRMPEFSPDIVSCRWLDGATGPAVGARFEAVNVSRIGKRWKNRPVITVADPGREFAFVRTEPFAGRIAWRYRFEPEGARTRVIESYEVERPVSRLGWLVIERIFKDGNRREALRTGMLATLGRLKDTAEAARAAADAS